MGIFNKKDIVKIAQDDLNDAKLSSAAFTDETTRRKAFIDILGARLAMKLLFSKKIKANNLYSLYSIHNVLGQADISDIYYNGIKIDVRVVFSPDEIFIPKSHFEYGLLPDLYLVLALNQDLESAELLGCFEPESIDKSLQNEDCYFIEQENLTTVDNLKNYLDKFEVQSKEPSTDEEIEKAETLFLASIDNEITKEDKIFLFQQLANNFELREKFVELENFEILSEKTTKEESLLDDGVLDIIGNQKFFNEVEAAEEAGIEIETEIIDISNKEDEINWDELDELSEHSEKTEEKEESQKSDFAKTLAEGAIIAGGTAVAGGMLAAGAAALAQNATVTTAATAAGGLASATSAIGNAVGNALEGSMEASDSTSSVVVENTDSFDSLESREIEFSDDAINENFLGEQEEQAFASLEELEEQTEQSFAPLEEPKEQEEQAFASLEELEEQIEQSFAPLEELDESTGFSELGEIPELDELPELEEFSEIGELNDLNKDPLSEGEEKEDTVDLDDFDFGMFDEEDSATLQELSQEDSLQDKETLSFDALAKEGSTANLESELEDVDAALEEIDDEAIEERNKSDDLDDLSSQVDDLLKDIELSDEQKDLLQSEIGLGSELQDEINSFAGDVESKPITNENIDLLTATTGPLEEDKDLLNALFQKENLNNGEAPLELGDREKSPADELKKKKKLIIAASVAGVMLVSIIAGGIAMNNNKDATFPASTTQGNTMPQDTLSQMPTDAGTTSADGATMNPNDIMNQGPTLDQTQAEQQMQPNRDMGKAVSDAFLSEPVTASISKIAWEVPEDLAYNDGFRKYLQMAGKNLKLTLSNDLLLTNELAYSNKAIVDLKIAKDGTVQSSNFVVSSGSKQIDGIVLQSVKETLKYLKMPAGEVNGQSVNATLIINF